MTSYWPKELNAKNFDPEQREVIQIHEQMRQMTERITKLEDKK